MLVLVQRRKFTADVLARVEWLAEHRPEDQLDHFLAALAMVRDQVARAPLRGAPVRQDRHAVMRLRLFPRPLPYLVYYAHRQIEPITEVHLLRLFGSGQDHPGVEMPAWPW